MNRQSTTAQRGSSRWATTVAESTRVVCAILLVRIRRPHTTMSRYSPSNLPAPEGCRARRRPGVCGAGVGSRSEHRGRSRHGGGGGAKPGGSRVANDARGPRIRRARAAERRRACAVNRVPRRVPTTSRCSSRSGRSTRSRTRLSCTSRAETTSRRAIGFASWWTRTTTAARRTQFAVNPDGVKQDRYWFNDSNSDISWDAVWDVTVSRDSQGWLAEFRIPSSQLRFTPSDTNTFGFAVVRDVGRLRATSTWPLLARSAERLCVVIRRAGRGDDRPRAAKRLELTPYTVASLTRQPASGNPLIDSASAGTSFGVDMKDALTPGLTLTASLNPDFGQVEADPATVNLSAFETFFNERRPFFVEGSGNFRFDADCYDGCNNLFYSRRIGRSPHATLTPPADPVIYTDMLAQTTILGAAKLTGRIPDVIRSRRRARRDAGGVRRRVCPRTPRWCVAPAGGTAHQLFGGARTSRIPEPVCTWAPLPRPSTAARTVRRRCPITRWRAARTSTGGWPAATASPGSSKAAASAERRPR